MLVPFFRFTAAIRSPLTSSSFGPMTDESEINSKFKDMEQQEIIRFFFDIFHTTSISFVYLSKSSVRMIIKQEIKVDTMILICRFILREWRENILA